MPRNESHVMHNLTQYLILPFLISLFSLILFPWLDPMDVAGVAFFGSLLPDVDHINIWFEYKFKDFKSFLRFVTKARRYRYSFLIFHNVASMFVLLMMVPFVARIEPLGGIFLVSFLLHLFLDFIDDKISIGRVTHWRYRRKT